MVLSRRKYRETWERWLISYSRRAYRELKNTFKVWTDNIAWDLLTESNYQAIIAISVDTNPMIETYVEIYTQIGLVHGARVGRGINRQLKQYTYDAFEPYFKSGVTRYLTVYGGTRIRSVEDTYVKEITNLLATRLDDGLTIDQAAREVKKIVDKPSFYKWQATRIARTESTAAANYAATQVSEIVGFVMEKEWISALDSRTRGDHRAANGQRVPQRERFVIDGEQLRFPGDPAGSAGNVINCRCTVAIVPARDQSGNLIPR